MRTEKVKELQRKKTILRYQADLYPVFIVLLTATSIALPFVFNFHIIPLLLLTAVSFSFRGLCALHHHNHGHLKTFNYSWLNNIYDVILSIVTGFTTSGWELHHNLGHHKNYLESEQDPISLQRFKCTDDRLSSRIKYTVLGDFFAYPDCVKLAWMFWKKGERKYLIRFTIQFVFQVALFIGLFLFKPIEALLILIAPAIFFRWAIFWMSYNQHRNTDPSSVYTSSNNILEQPYDRLNIGHHTAHHEKPTLHWSLLPARTAQIRHLIPESRIKLSKYRKESVPN